MDIVSCCQYKVIVGAGQSQVVLQIVGFCIFATSFAYFSLSTLARPVLKFKFIVWTAPSLGLSHAPCGVHLVIVKKEAVFFKIFCFSHFHSSEI